MAPRTLATVKKERDRLYNDLDVNYQEACEIMRVSYAAGASINSLCKAWNTTDRRTIRRMLGDTMTVDPLAVDKPILSTFLRVEPLADDPSMTHAWVEQDNPVPPTAWVHEKNEVLRKASPSRLRCFGITSFSTSLYEHIRHYAVVSTSFLKRMRPP